MPDDIRDVSRNMIERASREIRLVSKREKRDTRSDACAENPNSFVPFVLQPTHGGTSVQHRLSHRLDRAADVRADQVIGAFEFRGSSLQVIRQRQSQCRHADEIEYPAIGERLMCTSSGDKKMLTTVGDPGSDATGFTRVTRPSAGATTTFGSSGGTRCGSRKKYAIKAATIRNNTLTYHNPRIAVAILTNSGTRMNGIPSRTILNGFVLRTLYFVLGFFVFSQWSVVSCPLTKYKHQEPILTSKGTRNFGSTSPSILNSEKPPLGSFSGSDSVLFDIAPSSNTSDPLGPVSSS